jgi:F-type H+-transporting ATPase subunit gamma
MPSTRDIRRRIRSVRSTAQITKAMQMVAASKMRKAQNAALATIPFARLLYHMQRAATTHAVDFAHPLTAVREVRRRAVILVGTDRGLCGALNANLLRETVGFDPASTVFIAAGRKAAQLVARSGRRLIAEYTYGDTPRFEEARAISAFARDLFLKGEVDEVRVAGTRFVNTLTQEPVLVEFLPVGAITGLDIPAAPTAADPEADAFDAVFEPSAEWVLGYLLSHYLNIFIFHVLLHAKASEQSARMVSMKNATDSAETLIQDLTLEYNKRRQTGITQELLEIAGGQAG